MGSNESSIKIKEIPYEKKMTKLNYNFRDDKFAKYRNSSSIHKDLKAFCKIGRYLNDKSPSCISKDKVDKVCFLIINTYNRKTYQLGSGPINDGYMIALQHYQRGYYVYFLHNPTKKQFETWASFFLKNTQKYLTIFYEGRSTTLVGTKGDVIKGQCDAIVFELDYLRDQEMGELLSQNTNKNCKVLLISNCCKGPSIWCLDSARFEDIKLPPNITSISPMSESGESSEVYKKNKKEEDMDGIFIYHLLKIEKENPNITPNQLAEQIDPQLNKYGLSLYHYSTSSDLDSQIMIS